MSDKNSKRRIISYSPQGIDIVRTSSKGVEHVRKEVPKYQVRGSNTFGGIKKTGYGMPPSTGDISNSSYDNFFHPSYSPDLYVKPYSVYEERNIFRYYYENDPYVGHAIDILSELPLSKIHHSLPSTADHEKAVKIQEFIKMVSDKINLFQLLMSISHEYWLYGDVFIYVEKTLDEKDIERVVILDPNLVKVEPSYLASKNIYYLMPDEKLRELIVQSFNDEIIRKKLSSIPEELQKAIVDNRQIELNTNAFDGSFVFHLANRKSPYLPLGVPALRRCLNDLLYRERLRQAQISISMRNLAPKHLITTTARLDPGEIEDLRDQIDAAMENPDYAVFTTFEVNWNQIGAENRLLQLQAEYDEFNTRFAAGLGLKKELLFGEGVFGDTKLGVDMLDKRFSLFRDLLKNFVEDYLWAPICYKNGFVEKSDNYTVILTPGLSFSRLSLRDNETIFANLFQLYSKGSVSIRTILDLFNIDADTELKYLQADTFTLNDSRFNDMLSSLYTEVGNSLGSDPRVQKLIAERGLNFVDYNQLPTDITSAYRESVFTSSNSDSKKSGNLVLPGKNDKERLASVQSVMLERMRQITDRDKLITPNTPKIFSRDK